MTSRGGRIPPLQKGGDRRTRAAAPRLSAVMATMLDPAPAAGVGQTVQPVHAAGAVAAEVVVGAVVASVAEVAGDKSSVGE
jgi:hypothetical protein